MNKLVEEIIKPILEANPKVKRIVGIYGGRFQPFGPHHKKVYQWLSKQFDDAYITTSNIKKLPRHPMNFKEKVRHMSKMGIPSNKIIMEKTPFVAKSLERKFNSETTAFVYIFGAKDTGRLSGGKYFQDFKKNRKNLKGFKEHGYYLVAPHMSVSAGGLEVSGTSMRELLGSPKYKDQREKLFKKMFGYFDKGVFKMMTNKFSKLFEGQNNPNTPADNYKFDFEPIGKDMPKGEEDLLLDINFNKIKPKLKKVFQNIKKEIKQNKKLGKVITKYIKQGGKLSSSDRVFAKQQFVEALKLVGLTGLVLVPFGKFSIPVLAKIADMVGMDLLPSSFKEGVETKDLDYDNIDGGEYREYDCDDDSDMEEPYRPKKKLKKESVKLNIKPGDTILMGRFKNKRVKIKTIDTNEKGDLLINGRPALKFRIANGGKVLLPKPPEIDPNPFGDDIEEFLTTVDFKDIIKEANVTSGGDVDDGPSFGFGTHRQFVKNNKRETEKLGFYVVDYILKAKSDSSDPHPEYPDGPPKSVSFAPAGIGTGKTANNQEDYYGARLWMKWDQHAKRLAQLSGLKFLDYLLTKNSKSDVKGSSKNTIDANTRLQPADTKKRKPKDQHKNLHKVKVKQFKESLSREWWEDVLEEAKCGVGQNPDDTGCTPASKSKTKSKKPNFDFLKNFKIKLPDPKKVAKAKVAATMRKLELDKKYKNKQRKPNIVDGVDVIRDEKDLEHFVYEFERTGIKGTEYTKEIEKYDKEVGNQYMKYKSKLSKKEQKQLTDDVESWKSMGGYEAIQDAIEKGDTSEEEIRQRNERIRNLSHESITKVKQPIERGITIPTKDIDTFLSNFKVGEMVDIPDESGHGASGFSIQKAESRKWSRAGETDEVDKVSVVMRIKPNSRGEIRGLYVDGDPDTTHEEGEITRSSKSKSKVEKIETVKYPNGKLVKIITMVEPDDLSEVVREEKESTDFTELSKKYLEGPLNPKPKLKKKKVKESFSVDWWKENLLVEGGAYGHMAHPFDDKDLTFGDLKKIITLGLGGQLNREDNVTEKLDGQNIMISWRDGKLIAARNKGHIKNGGKTALDAKGIASKFKGRGAIRNAFVFAMRDLEKAIGGLSQKQKDKIFDNGHNFMNMEVMYPSSANVIDYDVTQLVFHGALKYDENAKVIGEVPGSGRMLGGMIQQINQHIQKKYSIGKPQFLTVPKHQDFGKMKGKFLGRLSRLQSQFGLKDSDELSLYHQAWWESFIRKQNKKVSPKVLKGLVKRWAYFDKSYAVKNIKKDIKDEKFLEWVLNFDKKNHAAQVKKNMRPFEVLFFEVGAEILKNVQGFLAANPSKAVQGIRKRLNAAIADVRKGGDLKKLNRLKTQLDRLDSIGGVDSIVPSEGIVFKYNGKTYKFTGAFAPVNQITGLMSF